MQDKFLKLKSNLELNPSFNEIIKQRHQAVRSAIENKNPNIKNTKLIGSLQRSTRIQPRPDDIFDIDILVVMGSFDIWLPPNVPPTVTPASALGALEATVASSDRYAAKNPKQDAPTVTFSFADNVKVELVPAYINMIDFSSDGKIQYPKGRTYWVPKNGKWELADYDYEAEHISKQNALADELLVPTIKMLKAIKRNHFADLSSFPLEIIAAEVVPHAIARRKLLDQETSYQSLITDFFIMAGEHISKPIKISGSHSPAIEHDLLKALQIKNSLDKIKNHILTIPTLPNEEKKVLAWRQLFGDAFPVS